MLPTILAIFAWIALGIALSAFLYAVSHVLAWLTGREILRKGEATTGNQSGGRGNGAAAAASDTFAPHVGTGL